MINPNLNINKAFREQLDKCMKPKYGPITQPHIIATFSKKENKSVRIMNIL